MSGYYYPTEEALMFFEGTKNIPKKRIFVRDKDGKHLHVSDAGESRSFSQYLEDFADRDSALKEYADALGQYREKLRQQPRLKPVWYNYKVDIEKLAPDFVLNHEQTTLI